MTTDIVKVELNRHPFVLHTLPGERIEALSVIISTGARANYLGLPSEEKYKNNGGVTPHKIRGSFGGQV